MDVLIAIFPPIAVGVLFYFVMRLIFQADRRERKLMEKMEAEWDAEHAESRREKPETADETSRS
ncbi:MAG: hypothetical protein Q4B12_01350 [Bowdeniella nasicola]|nr:hypothetical protein [Bowdeniella nasicola]